VIGLSQDERDAAIRVLREDYNLCGDDTGCLCEDSAEHAEQMVDKITSAVNRVGSRLSVIELVPCSGLIRVLSES